MFINMVKRIKNLENHCYKCKKKVLVKYVYPKRKYSDKNNWGWWTEKEENKNKYICDNCLSNLFHKKKSEYLENVNNNTKRATMRNYMCKLREIH